MAAYMCYLSTDTLCPAWILQANNPSPSGTVGDLWSGFKSSTPVDGITVTLDALALSRLLGSLD